MRGTWLSQRTGPDERALPGRSLSQPTADSSLYAREPLYRPQSEIFIGARLFSVAGHPSSVRAYALPPSPWGKATSGGGWGAGRSGKSEVFSLIRQGLRPATFPVGEGCFPAGEGLSPAGEGCLQAGEGCPPPGNSITVRCRRRTGPACRGLRGRRRRARGGR